MPASLGFARGRVKLVLSSSDNHKEYFDEDFFAYKEDVDLAWRLAARNTAIMFVPRVQAWHRRTARGGVDLTDRAATGNRRTKLTRVNALSWRNHWYVLLKSVPRDFWRRNWPFILWYELKKFIWLCLFERATLKQLPAVVKFWWQRGSFDSAIAPLRK